MEVECSEGSSSTVDIIIGSALILFFIVGLSGNISALVYFWSNRRKSVPDKLYIIVVSVDIGTCVATIPVIASLFNNRDPILFSNSFLCGCFTIAVYFLLRVSMFLVAVMSVTRSFAIIMPHRARYTCTMKRIIAVIAGYSLLLLFIDGVSFALGWMKGTYYRTERSHCSYEMTEKSPPWAKMFILIAFEIEVFVPSLVVFISFITGIVTLIRNASTKIGSEKKLPRSKKRLEIRKMSVQSTCDGEKISRRVSITIALFTAVFLVCNIPLFVYQMIHLLSNYVPSVKTMVDNSDVGKRFAPLLLLVMPYVLNAAVNPCLYLMRMPRYRGEFLSWGRHIQRRMCRLFT